MKAYHSYQFLIESWKNSCTIVNRLISFIEKMDIIYAKQFGFRAHHSTEHAILSIVDKIHEGIELKKGCFRAEYFSTSAKLSIL